VNIVLTPDQFAQLLFNSAVVAGFLGFAASIVLELLIDVVCFACETASKKLFPKQAKSSEEKFKELRLEHARRTIRQLTKEDA